MGQLASAWPHLLALFFSSYLVLNLEKLPGPDNFQFFINTFHNIATRELALGFPYTGYFALSHIYGPSL